LYIGSLTTVWSYDA